MGMKSEDREKLKKMLWDLVDTQDTVTHNLEAGYMYAFERAKAERKTKVEQIIRFCENLAP